MITLGVYRGPVDHAAVIVADGVVVSAVHAPGDASRPESSSAVETALGLAGVRLGDVTVLSTSRDLLPGAQLVSPEVAQAVQVRSVAPDARVAIVVDDGPGGRTTVVDLKTLETREVVGTAALLCAARSVAREIGLDCTHPIAALESIAVPESATTPVALLLAELSGRDLTPTQIAASPHVEIQRLRAQAATSALEELATALATVVERETVEGTSAAVAIAGTMCASPEFVARLGRRVAAVIAPVPERFGEALGAALLRHQEVRPLPDLALGAAFSEHDIKKALENCRLDYVYEPNWSRLYARASDLLATGALIGWYQGRADFSWHSYGSRSVLCDPSRRYSRENVNVFLMNRNVHTPIPLSLETAGPVASHQSRHRFAYSTEAPSAPAIQKLASAIDRHGRLQCHVVNPHATPEFHALLRTHRERTQVPGLLNVPMLAGGVLAPTPRDAIRETYASATDALVIGRFLVAKDYWLLRQ